MSKQYKIIGVDLKSELIIGFSILPFIVLGGILSIYLYHSILQVEYRIIPFYIVFGGLLLGMSIGLIFAKLLGKNLRATWYITLSNENLLVQFKDKEWNFSLEEVIKFKIYGNPNFKYISFWLNNEKTIKMRIGDSGLTPFSTKKDLVSLENFLNDVQTFFNSNYIKINKVKKISPTGTIKLTYIKKEYYMSSYLPDKTYAVCTNQLGVGYKQFTLSENRTNKTVKLGSQQRVFLVKLDKSLTSDFTCKSGWSSGAGTAAVGAGVLTGLAVAATVATVPVIGWIVGGAIAVGCLAYGIWQMMQSPTCSQMIGYEESIWLNHHQTIRFDSSTAVMKEKHLALVKNSMLKCKEPGGMLLPFISESEAKKAAEAIGYNNRREMATNIGAGFFTGFLFGTGVGAAAGSLAVLGEAAIFMGWTAAGHYVINPYVFSPATQKTNELANKVSGTSESYDQIKNGTSQKPDHAERDIFPDPAANNDTLQTLYGVLKNMKQNGASKKQISEINLAISEAEKAGTYKVNEVPAVKVALENIKSGKYGKGVKEIFTNKSGNSKGMNRQTNYESASNLKQEGVRANNQENLKNIRNASVLVVAPFISSYFGNEAIRLAAKIYDADISNSISVNALEY